MARNKAKVITVALVLVTLVGGVLGTFAILRQRELQKIPSYMERGQTADPKPRGAAEPELSPATVVDDRPRPAADGADVDTDPDAEGGEPR